MKQYIDKAAVIAEIERLIEINKGFKKTWKWKLKWFYRAIVGRLEVLEGLKIFLNTLEVKGVDLEKEIKEQIDKYYENCNKKLEEMGEDDNDISFLTLDDFARHFYELGLKSQKEG